MRWHRWLRSINARVLFAGLVVVLLFLLLAGLSLDRAFQQNARSSREELLQSELFMLMGTVELDPNGHIILPAQLNEPRFSLPGSGLYANIADVAANSEWQSSSTLGLSIPFERALTPGERVFVEHGRLETRIGTHVGADLLAREAGHEISREGKRDNPAEHAPRH